ncbi:MAG: sigma-70 family RNA polymerase sigma factor [Fusobacteria bacterium]|nr:sigma-70 family RNA polymerase sigma factor [Fusobacteriota bacterium]
MERDEVESEEIREESEELDIIKMYLNELHYIEPITLEEEYKISKAAFEGNEEAREKLYVCNLKLVVSLAKRYLYSGLPILDLIQEGNVGLVEAVNRFDVSKGYKFSTYAAHWIKKEIIRYIADQGKSIRIPQHVMSFVYRIKKVKREFYQMHSREPEIIEIAEILDADAWRVQEVLSYQLDSVSLEAPVGDEEEKNLSDFVEDCTRMSPYEEIERKMLKKEIIKVLDGLSIQEKDVIVAYYALENDLTPSIDSVADKFNISVEEVRQIEYRALKKLRSPNIKRKLIALR